MVTGFQYSSRVIDADGVGKKIGIVVNQRLFSEVMGYNLATGRIEMRPITNWVTMAPNGRFLQFTVAANEGSGRHCFGAAPDQRLLTPEGYRPASDLRAGDMLMSAVKHYLTPLQEQIVYGSILGDGSLRRVMRFNTQLRIGHGQKQDAYCLWKQSLFEGLIGYQGRNSKDGWGFDTIPMYELTALIEHGYDERGKSPSPELINKLTPLAVAIWYLDDGNFDQERLNRSSICCKSFPTERRGLAVDWFQKRGIDAKSYGRGYISFGVEATRQFHAMIALYVHPSMEHKLLPEYRGQFRELAAAADERLAAVPMPILDIHEKPETRGMYRFGLEIEGGDGYLVDGVIVEGAAGLLSIEKRRVREEAAAYSVW